MRKTMVAIALVLFAGPAAANGIGLGGVVDGFIAAQEVENQRRALELRNGRAAAEYEALVLDQRLRRIEQLQQEQNKLLRDREFYRPLRP